MRLSTASCLLAALYSASYVVAEAFEENVATRTLEYPTAVTPATELPVESHPNLEYVRSVPSLLAIPYAISLTTYPLLRLRQNLQVNPNAQLDPGQAPPVTIYTAINPAGAAVVETFTQLFSPVPDQWPSPQPGTIGYGTLHHKKREAESIETGIAGRIKHR